MPPASRTITARDVQALRGANGASVELPVDLDAAVVQLYARDDAGTWSVFAGEGRSDGTLHVGGATSGGAWLRVDYFDASPEPRPRNELFWIDAGDDVALELGTWRAGRGGVQIATTIPTELRLELSSLAPWDATYDRLVVVAPNLNFAQVFSQDADGISGMPAGGATGSTLAVDWAGALAAPLLDASRGDRAYALQLRFRMIDGMWLGTPVTASQLPPLTQSDGATATTTAAFAAANNMTVRVAMDRDAFDALRPAIGKNVGPAFGRGFAISASPSLTADDFSPTSLPTELVVVEGDALSSTGLFDLGDAAIASPYTNGLTYGRFISGYPVMVARDDGFVAYAQAEVGVLTNVLPTAAAPAAPLVGPVRDITIGGVPAFSAPTGVGLTPEIRWQPPAIGSPAEYEVKILAPGGADPTYDFLWYPSAIFHVPGDQTALALPPEILEPDFPYAIAIRAIAQPLGRDVLATTPRKLALPYGWADAITPAFKP